ncbi:MAG: 2-phosphosulfolactate phosphatase, partial [Gemmatimonadota bacterium]
MRIDVVFGPPTAMPALIAGRVIAVIDVLRASTSIAFALGNGARNIVPLESADEVITRAKQFDKGEVRLAGERKMLIVPGFDLGNSPGEFTREAVEGKTVLLTTTNGTAAMFGLQAARDVVVASYVNLEAVSVLM